jgi:hypothetical protein
VHTDAASAQFESPAFDAVVCLYALIHMDLEVQRRLLISLLGWPDPRGSIRSL